MSITNVHHEARKSVHVTKKPPNLTKINVIQNKSNTTNLLGKTERKEQGGKKYKECSQN